MLFASDRRASSVAGVEIDPLLAAAARENAARNGFSDAVSILAADLREDAALAPLVGAHAVTVNPPYFGAGSMGSPDPVRARSRSGIDCTFADAARAAARILRYGGAFFAVYRPEGLCDALVAMRENGLEPKRLRFVAAREDKEPFVFLVEGKKGAKPGLILQNALVLARDAEEVAAIYRRDEAYLGRALRPDKKRTGRGGQNDGN